MEYILDLESGSSPKIKKAAKNIIKNQLNGYCSHLLNALRKEIKKTKAWQTQCELIKAIGITNCKEALPFLKVIIDNNYENTILYRELSFAICLLENISTPNLDFLYISFAKGNEMQICGACAFILYKKIVPKSEDIAKIILSVSTYTEDEGRTITPRCYIAAVSYLWPISETKVFLETCMQSKWQGLIEISQSSLKGMEPKIKLTY